MHIYLIVEKAHRVHRRNHQTACGSRLLLIYYRVYLTNNHEFILKTITINEQATAGISCNKGNKVHRQTE